MRRTPTLGTLTCSLLMFVTAAAPAAAEFQCAPLGTTVALPEGDPFFANEVAAWSETTKSRYLEGGGNCLYVSVPGYEGAYKPLAAEVILLDPSAHQLAAWSLSACRTNGATDAAMSNCLKALRSHVIGQNGAQFPVVGSVVESYCNSSPDYPNGCDSLEAKDKGRQPRNTCFRDGVAVDYKPAQAIRWDAQSYPKETFDALFDVAKSDANLDRAYNLARVAGAVREEWTSWQTHRGKPDMPEGGGTVAGHGWRTVSAAVHKAACRGISNELFDAVVYANRKVWTGR
jgi:hypothetical protein